MDKLLFLPQSSAKREASQAQHRHLVTDTLTCTEAWTLHPHPPEVKGSLCCHTKLTGPRRERQTGPRFCAVVWEVLSSGSRATYLFWIQDELSNDQLTWKGCIGRRSHRPLKSQVTHIHIQPLKCPEGRGLLSTLLLSAITLILDTPRTHLEVLQKMQTWET